MSKPVFEQITIIGLGLIGSSIARGARKYQLCGTIVGCDGNQEALAYASQHQLIDSAGSNAAEAVKGSQLVILATPPSTLAMVAKSIAPHLAKNAIVMDVASVKEAAMQMIAPALPAHVTYIPAHPIAGSEKTGPAAGNADLFQNKRVIITPADIEENPALAQVTALWTGMGARIEGMPADVHDMIYGYVSHLPQLLAFAAGQSVDAANGKQNDLLIGFLRLTRSSPALWMDIFSLNKTNLLKSLDRYLDAILHIGSELRSALEAPAAPDSWLASHVLFPRIAASCLITTVMEAERNAGFAFARYAGSGFADFTQPAAQPPDKDIENISGQYKMVAEILASYAKTLKTWRDLIAADQFRELQADLRK